MIWLLLLQTAFATEVQVTLGIKPDSLHTVTVEADSPPQVVDFVSGVPIRATIAVSSPNRDEYQVTTVMEAKSTEVAEDLTGTRRSVIEALITQTGEFATPSLVFRKDERAELSISRSKKRNVAKIILKAWVVDEGAQPSE